MIFEFYMFHFRVGLKIGEISLLCSRPSRRPIECRTGFQIQIPMRQGQHHFGFWGLPFMTSALEGGGGLGKADIVMEMSKGGCVKMQTGGGRGSKNPKIFRTS